MLEAPDARRFAARAAEEPEFTILVDGEPIPARAGETIAAALYAAGIRYWRVARSGERRGLLCGMGICFYCLLTVEGRENVRACQELASPGQVVRTGRQEAL